MPARRLALISGLLLGLVAAGCAKQAAPPETQAPTIEPGRVLLAESSAQRQALTVEAVSQRRTNVLRLTGRLVWNDDVTVRVFSPVAGRVADVGYALGQAVPAGAVLARISSPDFGQAQADARKAQADLVLAERTWRRLSELKAHGAAAQKDVEAAENAQAAALAERERAAARLALYGGAAEVLDGLFPLRAPVAGTVVERNLSPGQEVRPDQMLGNVPQVFSPLFVLSDPTRLWLLLDATETDMLQLKPGQPIQVHARPYGERPFPGQLEVVGDALDPATRTVRVRGTVANPERLLKAEMYVTVDLATNIAPTVEVPVKAVFLKENRAYAFVEDAPGRFARRELKTGTESDGRITVHEGLKPGDRVVTEGCLLLQTLLEGQANS